jgi:hypothetical protein
MSDGVIALDVTLFITFAVTYLVYNVIGMGWRTHYDVKYIPALEYRGTQTFE